jgi:hypothetical protein
MPVGQVSQSLDFLGFRPESPGMECLVAGQGAQ